MALFSGGNSTPATTTEDRKGFAPNRFALQMTGSNPSIASREPLGFGPGSERLANQIPGMTGSASMESTGTKPTSQSDPWADFGILGEFFRMIDAQRVKSGMPSLAGSGIMEPLKILSGSTPQGPFLKQFSGIFMDPNKSPS